jgi:hypothetical protein
MTDITQPQRPDIYALPNVHNTEVNPSKLEDIPLRVCRFVWVLAKEYPLWTFKTVGWRTFKVFKDGEELGQIGEEWYGAKQALCVRNDRIAQQTVRKNAYHTQDLEKAVLRVKKMFKPMTLLERMNKANEEANKVLLRQYRGVNRNHQVFKGQIDRSLAEYAYAHMGQYMMWLKGKNDLTMLGVIDDYEKSKVDMQTIEEAQKAFDNKYKHALIVLADGKYIVKVLDNVQLYDDTTLPHDLRGKLGMLKLVEAEQMVTGIGCRVSDEIFVVLHESNDEIKTQ